MGVGSRLKKILHERGISIKQLADYSGVPVNTLYSITKRNSEMVRDDTLKAIADALGVTKSYLRNGEDNGEVVIRARDIRELLDREKIKTIEDLSSPELQKFLKNMTGGLVSDPFESLRSNVEKKIDKYAEDYAGKDELLLEFYHELNLKGRKEAIKRTQELTRLPEYTEPDIEEGSKCDSECVKK